MCAVLLLFIYVSFQFTYLCVSVLLINLLLLHFMCLFGVDVGLGKIVTASLFSSLECVKGV